ncbi:unnamed protein product [Ambrosiozyma monospora]|uniref:Unnamed protein product n=1 Tax=Ambrosiozyma monospora TaxID=43982 RepID=A0ACB5SZV0_AMBMO|nr:unnamed protein product [Ambrosiozyma monospora]
MTSKSQKLPSSHNEFRSDTFTVPTDSMKQAIFQATDGDDVYGEDKDTNDLQDKVAKLAGKEAGLFCVSGTLSNQIAIRTLLTQPPYSVLGDYRSHVFTCESAGLAILSQALITPVYPKNGKYITLEDIIPKVIPDDIHYAPTKVVSLENTIHGIVMPLDEIKRISEWCRTKGIKVHLDGARLFNASVATGTPLADYCQYFDSISLCLSKSLGAPIGSVLVGDSDFITKANHFRKQNGGGIRQAGFLTRMASIAIDENLPRLAEADAYAKDFAKFCVDHGMELDEPADTNFVFIDGNKTFIDPELLKLSTKKYNVKAGGYRFAFHFQNSPEAIENLKKALLEAFEASKKIKHDSNGTYSKYA